MSDIARPARTPIAAIGIGASAGGLQPLRAVVAGLPADLPAAVFVVLHVAATGTSVLPQILQRVTPLEVARAEDGEVVGPGQIAVAPPDRHLIAEDAGGGRARLTLARGPRENGHRPAIDPLLRSLAEVYGDAAAGLILSGTRDDGTRGLAQVKALGGAALVQDPAEAEYASMPANALAGTVVDAALPVVELAPALAALARGEPLTAPPPEGAGANPSRLALHADGVERAMWTAARDLQDRSVLLHNLADRARGNGHERTADQFEAHARQARAESDAIRAAIAALDDDISADVIGTNGEEIA